MKKTHDFMNVDAFSPKERHIRIFGFEFGASSEEYESSGNYYKNQKSIKESSVANNKKEKRYKCHYCFRNFPTSQALGGHQNAHKRERQQIKRLNLHSNATAFNHVATCRFLENRFSLEAAQNNGSTLGLWRRYSSSARFNRDRLSYNRYMPLFNGAYQTRPMYISGGPSRFDRFDEFKTNVPDQVSLDLRL